MIGSKACSASASDFVVARSLRAGCALHSVSHLGKIVSTWLPGGLIRFVHSRHDIARTYRWTASIGFVSLSSPVVGEAVRNPVVRCATSAILLNGWLLSKLNV